MANNSFKQEDEDNGDYRNVIPQFKVEDDDYPYLKKKIKTEPLPKLENDLSKN